MVVLLGVLTNGTTVPLKGLEGAAKVNSKDGLSYVWIPPGKFMMGCSPGDPECFSEEKPAHEVEIQSGFWMGQTEVTQTAYVKVMKTANPSKFKGPNNPVERVRWSEAKGYCEAVGLRLPTEAEWEYAARAGSTVARYGPIDQVAWYSANSSNSTHPVAKKTANAWGLYDMLGNVWEWTADLYPRTQARVLRGGAWDEFTRVARASHREGGIATVPVDDKGFRCVGEMR